MTQDNSQGLTPKSRTVQDQRYLTFSLANESYAVPLFKVREVIALGELTKVPNTPAHYSGIMNLRGQVIPVIDLRVKLRMPQPVLKDETAIIILDLGALCLGIIIDSVDAVLPFSTDQISASPDIESSVSTDYIIGIARLNKKLILILDIEKTLSVEDLIAMKSQVADRKVA